MLERFFKAKSFGLHISKPKKIPGNIFFDISKVRKSTRRSLLGRQKCILSQKSVPQGPFGRIKLYFEPEKHPAGGFWADKIVFLSRKSIPQGAFGRIKLYSEQKKYPAGAFWADKIVF